MPQLSKIFQPFVRTTLACVAFVSAFAHTAHAQLHSITILDANTLKPIVGATLTVAKRTQLVSDAQGNVFLSVPPPVDVVATCLGYTPQKTVSTSRAFSIYMMPNAIEIKPLLLNARAGYNAPIAHQNISKKNLETTNYGQDLPYLLQNTVGAVVTSDAGTGIGYTSMRIRGTDASRINVTINGIALNDAESQNVYWVDVPDIASSTQSIQIQRGVGTSASGSGAFGASINVLTNNQTDKPYIEYSGTMGAFNTNKNTLSFGTGSIQNKWIFDGRISKINSDGYIQRASAGLQSGGANLGYYGKKNTLKATVLIGKERTYQAWYGVPQDSLSTQRTYNPAGYYTQIGSEKADFYTNQTDNYTQNHYQLFYTHHFNNNMQIGATLYRSTGAGYYQEYQDNKKWSDFNLQNPMLKDTANNIITNLDIITQRWLSNVNDGINAAFNWRTGKFTLDAGANVGVYKGSHFGNISWAQYNPVALDSNFINPNVSTNNSQTVLYYLNFAKKTDASAFVKSSYGFFRNKMIVFADVQARYVSYDFAPKPYNVLNPPTQNVQYLFINPKLGATYAPNSRHSVYAYYGIANREPAREDMVNAPENQRPTPENLQNIELGYRYVKSKMNLELNAYLMQYKNQMVLTGAINDVGEFTRVNVAQSYRRGIELSGGYGSGKLALNGNIALSQNKIRNFDEYAPDYINGKNIWIKTHKNTDISFAPAVVASLALSLKPISNLPVIEWNTKYVGSQYMDNTMNANRRIAAYWTHSLRLTQSYKFTNNIKELGWAVQANNLLNAIYNNNGYTYSYYYNRPADPTLYTSNNYFPQATRHLMVMFFVKI